ncbi:MAG: hypothetical protein ABIR33_17190 [Pyrinomonadaceae bacterium]
MSDDLAKSPISYVVDTAVGVIFEVWDGTVTASDLSQFWRDYLSDPEVLEVRTTLVDLRKATIKITGNEMRDLVSSVVQPALGSRTWRTAIVVDRPVQYGVSRQYQVFAEYYSTDCIFYETDEALAWLLKPQRTRFPSHPE